MALRYERRSGGPMETVGAGLSAADVGRLLRQERNRQGLSLRDVSARTGIPQDQLRAAETGALSPSDGLATLKTVRRFADLLGLPGDRYALAILEQWPTRGGAGPRAVVGAPRAGTRLTAAVGAAGQRKRGAHDDTGNLRAFKGGAGGRAPMADDDLPTAAVPIVSRWGSWTDPASEPLYPDAFSDTGVTPAVPGAGVFRRERHMPLAVKALIGLVVLAVVAGVALLVVDRVRPAWLREAGILKAAPAASAAPAVQHHATQPAASTSKAASGTARRSAAALRVRKTSDTRAVIDAGASTYTVKVSAVGGPCWVQVTSSSTPTPLFAGIVEPGTTKTFSSGSTTVVELGSSAGRVSVSSSAGHLRPTRPAAAPFRYEVRAS